MKKIKTFLKKHYPEILSFIIPALIIMIGAYVAKIYPFGENSFAKYDGYYQYPGFTSYFRKVLLGQADLFYSFKGALGYNFYATAIYYLFNPTNILSIFFDNAHILEYYCFLVYLRAALCGLTMCLFLKYKYKTNNNMFLILLSVAYGVMAYNVCYFFNYMYYDVVVLFPIVMIGLEKLIHEDNVILYIVSLTISILSNFYIGYMVCLFTLLYFIYNYILLKHKNKKIIKHFAISSILCGLMCAIILIPEIYGLLQGKVMLYDDPTQTQYLKFNMNFLNFFYKSTPGSMTTFDIKYGTVNVYCSLLTIIMVIKYFFNKQITVKEKIVTGSFIAFFLLSISFNLIDYFWHFMQRPIWYPNRYIFTFSFFLITIAYRSYIYRDAIKIRWPYKIIASSIFLMLTIYPAIKSSYYDTTMQMVCLLLSFMVVFQYMFFTENKNAKYLVLGLFIIEVSLNTIISFKQLSNSPTLSEYKYTNSVYEEVANDIKEYSKDKTFYRYEFSETASHNNGALYNYNGISIFTSIRNQKVMKFFDRYFGYTVRDNASIAYTYKNPYISSILGIEYMTGNANEAFYERISTNKMNVYENKESLGLGFMAKNSVYDIKFVDANLIENTEILISKLSDINDESIYMLDGYTYDNIIFRSDPTTGEKVLVVDPDSEDYKGYISLKGVAKTDGFVVYDKKATYYTSITGTINGKDSTFYFSGNTLPIFLHKGDAYDFKIVIQSECEEKYIDYYVFNYDTYLKFVNEMQKNLLKITKYKTDSRLEGEVIATKDKNVLFTSIPYDKGWNVYVDNKKVDYNVCADTFICLDLDEGKHFIKFNYIPQGFILGTIITLLSLGGTIFYIKKRKD